MKCVLMNPAHNLYTQYINAPWFIYVYLLRSVIVYRIFNKFTNPDKEMLVSIFYSGVKPILLICSYHYLVPVPKVSYASLLGL